MVRFTLAVALLFQTTVSFTVVGIDCSKCGPPVKKALESVAGVKNVRVDTDKKVAWVDVPVNFDREKLRTALEDAGFDATFAGEKRPEMQALSPEELKKLDIVAYTNGKAVDIPKVVAPGKVTVVDYYADWCGPCRVLETRLQHYLQTRPNIAVRRVDIGHWDNAAARQATREFHVEALPYIRVYDAHGKFVTDVTGGMWDEVLAAIEKAE